MGDKVTNPFAKKDKPVNPDKVDGPDKNQGAGNDAPKKNDPVTVDGEDVVEAPTTEENLGQAEADASGDASDNPNEPQSTYDDTEVDRVQKEKEARHARKA